MRYDKSEFDYERYECEISLIENDLYSFTCKSDDHDCTRVLNKKLGNALKKQIPNITVGTKFAILISSLPCEISILIEPIN